MFTLIQFLQTLPGPLDWHSEPLKWRCSLVLRFPLDIGFSLSKRQTNGMLHYIPRCILNGLAFQFSETWSIVHTSKCDRTQGNPCSPSRLRFKYHLHREAASDTPQPYMISSLLMVTWELYYKSFWDKDHIRFILCPFSTLSVIFPFQIVVEIQGLKDELKVRDSVTLLQESIFGCVFTITSQVTASKGERVEESVVFVGFSR